MVRPIDVVKPNGLTDLLETINVLSYFFGLKYIWITDVKFSPRFINIHNKVLYLLEFGTLVFSLSVFASFYTQKNLTKEQENNQLMLAGFTLTFLFLYILKYYQEEIRKLLYCVVVELKEHYNDVDLERQMIKKIKMFSTYFFGLVMIAIMKNILDGLFRMVIAGEEFTTFTPAWPDVHDTSTMARVFRILDGLWWLPMGMRVSCRFVIIVTMMLAVCYQFKNLQSYFYSLNNIFSDKILSQAQKEMKYEQAFKVGIKMHSETLRCVKLHQHISKEIFGLEILIFFGMLMAQMSKSLENDRTTTEVVTAAVAALASCLDLEIYMWTGGDITIQASNVAVAMYSSGWENCYGQSSVRIRKLIVNAMAQAQQPVVYKAFGVVEFSYEAYVRLIRLPYSVLSVFH